MNGPPLEMGRWTSSVLMWDVTAVTRTVRLIEGLVGSPAPQGAELPLLLDCLL